MLASHWVRGRARLLRCTSLPLFVSVTKCTGTFNMQFRLDSSERSWRIIQRTVARNKTARASSVAFNQRGVIAHAPPADGQGHDNTVDTCSLLFCAPHGVYCHEGKGYDVGRLEVETGPTLYIL
ncbi:hypothetical protein EVAR_18181_1 [Eumeta japonica]|uniref:Uncharacterized protein n=1 Tax=Eumeta variegata TaxID=151549 RepID=A0A4C1UWL5_EUMVA|nr:hypothetical protein EVAR_18181_1 [Eumeta japonica]